MTGDPKRTVSIDIVSDTICPWCYVGKSRLDRAISSLQAKPEGRDLRFSVTWHPFQLKPELPMDDPGSNKREMYSSKFGAGRAEAIVSTMTKTFQEEGLPSYNMDGMTGSTLHSHRLLAWAAKEFGSEMQNKLVDALFQGYFTKAQNINDKEFLQSAAEAAGLPRNGAAAVLSNPEAFLEQVSEELQQARAAGISGVPNFSIGSVQLSGAQDPALLERALLVAAAS